MSHLRNAALDLLTTYLVASLFTFCAVLAYSGDYYGVFPTGPPSPNDAPFVVAVGEGVGGVFDAVEVVVEEIGERIIGRGIERDGG